MAEIQAIVLQIIQDTSELNNANVRYEIDLRERTIRVEELKHQRELMQEGFKQMEKRFEQVDKRFTETNRRLDFYFIFCFVGVTISCALFVVTYLK